MQRIATTGSDFVFAITDKSESWGYRRHLTLFRSTRLPAKNLPPDTSHRLLFGASCKRDIKDFRDKKGKDIRRFCRWAVMKPAPTFHLPLLPHHSSFIIHHSFHLTPLSYRLPSPPPGRHSSINNRGGRFHKPQYPCSPNNRRLCAAPDVSAGN